MMCHGKAFIFITFIAGVMLLGLNTALAQDEPSGNMQILVEKVRADKKLLVAANLNLTESEAGDFWPIYQDYQNELFLLRAHTARLINDYAEAYDGMTEEKAEALLDDFMRIETLDLKLRQAYLPKFREVLPARKVARYYQIENKIQAVLYYELAGEIPLMQ